MFFKLSVVSGTHILLRTAKMGLYYFLIVFSSSWCVYGREEWAPNTEGVKLNHLARSLDDKYLYITGTNRLYSLNATSFALLNERTTGPVGGVEDISHVLKYYSLEKSEYVWSCGSLRCDTRTPDTLSVLENIILSLHQHQVAFRTQLETKKYTYIGTPHGENENDLPFPPAGIYELGGDSVAKFKKTGHTDVLTQTFVAAFDISKHGFFFSVQENKNTDQSLSRVAQICRTGIHPIQYIDMPIKCGNFTVLKVVDWIAITGKKFILAAFVDEVIRSSAVCLFSLDDLKER